LVLL
jgi:hypothetical protein